MAKKKKKILPKEKRNDVKPYTGNTWTLKQEKEWLRERRKKFASPGPEHWPAHKPKMTLAQQMMKGRPGLFQMCSVNIY